MDNKIHTFEQAGLGKAPFACVAVFTGNALVDPEHPLVPVTSCQYCYTVIANCFRIESSDGKSFIVGCDCVKKTGDKGLVKKVDEMLAQLKYEKLQNDYLWAIGNYKAYSQALEAMPHLYSSEKNMFYFIWECENHQLNIYDTTRKACIKAVKEAKKIMGGKSEVSLEALQAKRDAELELSRKAEKERLEAEELAERQWNDEYQKGLDKAKELPHPNAFFAKRGKTLRDYIDFMLDAGCVKRNFKIVSSLRTAGANI